MKKFLIALTLLIAGCSSTPKETEQLPIQATKEIGFGRYVTVAQVNFLKDPKDNSQKFFKDAFASILSSELTANGFAMLERVGMKEVVKEHAFSKTMGNRQLGSNFYVGEYSVFLNIRNIGYENSNFILPVLYHNVTKDLMVDLDLKFVDNTTGLSYSSSGSGVVSTNEWSLLIFIGSGNSNDNKAIEEALILAIRDALSKLRFR